MEKPPETKRRRVKVQDLWKSSRYFLIGVNLLLFILRGLYSIFNGEVLIGLLGLVQAATLPWILRGRDYQTEMLLLFLLYLSRLLLDYYFEIGLSVFALVLIGTLLKELKRR